MNHPSSLPAPHIAERPMEPAITSAWLKKARINSEPLLSLAQDVANPSIVAVKCDTDPTTWPYGRFMLAWLDESASPRLVHHLPDASFFLRILGLTFADVFAERPELLDILSDYSRPEMSITNDVLQIQLRSIQPGYSMIRHHALMLFIAVLWLDEPRRTQWLEFYEAVVVVADARPGGRPSLDRLATIEASAFDDFLTIAPRTIDLVDAEAVLDEPSILANIIDYQFYAGVAIGLLSSEYRQTPLTLQDDWLREQLSRGYMQDNYLEMKWTTQS
jgi:hypothetical protein